MAQYWGKIVRFIIMEQYTYRFNIKSQYFIHVKRQLSEQKIPTEIAQCVSNDQCQKWSTPKDTFPRDFCLCGDG